MADSGTPAIGEHAPLDYDNLRHRLARGDGLCLEEHTVNRSDDGIADFWITCGGVTINRAVFPVTADPDRDIQAWMTTTMASHRATVAERIVKQLLYERDRNA